MYQDGPITIVEFTPNRMYAMGTAVFRLPNGNVVVVRSTLNDGGTVTTMGAFAIYSASDGAVVASGAIGADRPSISAAGSGFAIASGKGSGPWYDISPTDLSVRFYDSDGDLLTTTLLVETTGDARDNFYSDMATLAGGTLAVVWTGARDPAVYVQRLDAAGNKLGSAMQIGTEVATGYLADVPTIAALSDGGFVVAWVSHTATNDTAIIGQKFDASGNTVGNQFSIDPIGDAVDHPQLAGLPGGGFVMVWSKAPESGGNTSIDGQIFGGGGSPIAPVFSVAGTSSGTPEVAADAQGNFVVLFLDSTDAGGQAYAQAYTATGANQGSLKVVPGDFFSSGYSTTAIAATSTAGVFEFSLQSTTPALTAGFSTLTGTLNLASPPLDRPIEGTAFTDILVGDAGDNLFVASGEGFNPNYGSYVPDTYDGGAGNDTITYAGFATPAYVTLANFTSIENLIGSAFDDTLAGTDAANRLDGGAGNDVIFTGRGGDTVIGGAGTDTVGYDDSNGTVVVNLTLGKGFNNYADSDTYSGIENVSGSPFDDILIGDGGVNELRGQAGNDLLIGALGADVLMGGDGIDTAEYSDSIGTVFVNLTLGKGFNNSAEGDLLFDIENLTGSRFADFFIGDALANRLDGGQGNDTLIGAMGADVLIGGDGIDTASYEDNQGAVFVNLATGMGFNNAAQGDTYQGIEDVTGGLFNDYLIGDSGANQLDGMAGDDILIGGLGADALVGGAGFDTASYEDNWGAVFVNLLTGQGASNAAQGDTFDSIEGLVGSVFYDTFIGNDEGNVLNGKRGADTLTGNGGNDDFVFDTALDGQINVDHITDFTSGQDRIVLDRSVFFNLTAGALQSNNLIFGTSATGGQNRIVYDQATGNLWFDDDGNGSDPAVLFAVLDNHPTITSADFIVV